jgi:hypothetical protein
MDMHIMIAAVARDMAPGFMELHYHGRALGPMLAAGVYRCFKHTLFAPSSPGLHGRMLLIAEVKTAFIQSTLGVGRNAAVAVGLLEISADLFEILLILFMFGPLEIIHHHRP